MYELLLQCLFILGSYFGGWILFEFAKVFSTGKYDHSNIFFQKCSGTCAACITTYFVFI